MPQTQLLPLEAGKPFVLIFMSTCSPMVRVFFVWVVFATLLFAHNSTAFGETEIAKTNTIFAANGMISDTPKEMTEGFVNIYTYRSPLSITPLLEMFTKKTGIRTRVVLISQGADEVLRRESRTSPVDILIANNAITLEHIRQEGLLARVYGIGVRNGIPNSLMARDDSWFALSTRTQAVYTTKSGVGKLPDNFTYMNLADPEYRGRICVGAGDDNLNLSLLAEIIAEYGEGVAENWLVGLKSNLARKPKGGDRSQLKDLNKGVCDLALGNSYYMGAIMNNPREINNVENIVVNFPIFSTRTRATFVDISGIAVAKHAPNRDSAIKFVEFMLSERAQKTYAAINYEYPARKEVLPPSITTTWGKIKPNNSIKEIYQNYDKAVELSERVGINL